MKKYKYRSEAEYTYMAETFNMAFTDKEGKACISYHGDNRWKNHDSNVVDNFYGTKEDIDSEFYIHPQSFFLLEPRHYDVVKYRGKFYDSKTDMVHGYGMITEIEQRRSGMVLYGIDNMMPGVFADEIELILTKTTEIVDRKLQWRSFIWPEVEDEKED